MSKKYKNREWLFEQFVVLRRTQGDIGLECGVSDNTISYCLRDFGITGAVKQLWNAQRHARSIHGLCLSLEYTSNKSKMLWECSVGHKWRASYNAVVDRGTWCPECSGHARLTLQDAIDAASVHNGKFLSTDCKITALGVFLWECEHGHRWKTSLGSILYAGTWCPYCSGMAKHTIQDARDAAGLRGGKCLSKKYVNASTKLKWECGRCGYIWDATWASVVNSNRWCPACAKVVPPTMEQIRSMAESRGGKCLSDTYVHSASHLEWECELGHRWESSYSSVHNAGTWCPVCNARGGKSEEIFRSRIEHILGVKFPKCRPGWLKSDIGKQMEIDGYNSEMQCGFEYQGRQHTEYIPYFHRDYSEFERRVELDKIKARVLSDRGINMLYPDCYLEKSDYDKFILERIEDA